MSPISFSMLSGAGVVKGSKKEGRDLYVHTTYDLVVEAGGPSGATLNKMVVKITDEERNGADIVVSKEAPVYPVLLDSAGAQAEYLSAITEKEIFVEDPDTKEITNSDSDIFEADGRIKDSSGKTIVFVIGEGGGSGLDDDVKVGDTVRIDCYEVHNDGAYEMTIDADTFAGYYYIEASTLFRDEATGEDLPAEFIIPRGKIQSNFTFTMANNGDPSTSNVGAAA